MQTYTQLFKAGVPTTVGVRGSTFIIQASDQGNTLEVDFQQNGATVYQLKNIGAGAKVRPVLAFDGVIIKAAVDTNVTFIVTDGDIDIQITQQNVTVQNSAVPVGNGPAPLHVTVDGTVNVSGATLTATNVGINNTSANPVPVQAQPPASAPSDVTPVAVGTAGGVLLAASAGRKGFRVYNAGTGKMGITAAAATTFANAAVVLNPGDSWNETDAPQAAWYAVSDTGTTANLQVVA